MLKLVFIGTRWYRYGYWQIILHQIIYISSLNWAKSTKKFLPFLLLEKGVALCLNKLETPFTKGWFVPKFGLVVLERKILKMSLNFRIFPITLLWKRGPFIWINLNSLYPRMICAKFGLLVLETKIFKCCHLINFDDFPIISSFEKNTNSLHPSMHVFMHFYVQFKFMTFTASTCISSWGRS